jgi:alpha-tubulin suppressor-like RCC1 family protein
LTLPNGNIYKGSVKDKSMDGYGKLFNAKGALLQEGTWEKNKLVSKGKINQTLLVNVFKSRDWKNIECSGDFMYAIKKDGSIWAYGNNSSGYLGLGDQVKQVNLIQFADSKEWKTIKCGYSHTLGLKMDGSLWDWGVGASGQTGFITSPLQKGSDKDWASINCGNAHSILVKTNGTLWSFGSNYYGELGIGTPIGNFSSTVLGGPLQIGTDNTWVSSFCGGGFTFAVKKDSSFWAWGNNESGQFCNGTNKSSSSPVVIENTNEWKDISCGWSHILILKKDGTLWSCGSNSEGQLGIANTINQNVPVQVGTDNNWSQISAGSSSSLAIKKDGSLWAWGLNTADDMHYTDLGARYYQDTPIQVGQAKDWKLAICNNVGVKSNAMAIKTDGSIWVWDTKNAWIK